MPPRLRISVSRTAFLRTKPCPVTRFVAPLQRRWASDSSKDLPVADAPKGPNQDQLPHVSEEAAQTGEIMNETTPQIEEHGTPVKEILERDEGAKDKMPEVMKNDSMNSTPKPTTKPSQSRSYSTSARRNADLVEAGSDSGSDLPVSMGYPNGGLGHKFGLPEMPLPRTEHLRRRYDPVVEQLTKSLMRHGKLSAAQKNMSIILDTLRTAPPPQTNPSKPLLSTFAPAPILPLSPIQYLTAAIDSVAPLIKIRQQRGVMGGGASLPIPVPLGVKQRRRTAMQWILTSADKRKESRLADRVAREIIGVAEGKSGVWDRRGMVHKMAVSARSNVRLTVRRR